MILQVGRSAEIKDSSQEFPHRPVPLSSECGRSALHDPIAEFRGPINNMQWIKFPSDGAGFRRLLRRQTHLGADPIVALCFQLFCEFRPSAAYNTSVNQHMHLIG